MDPKNKADRYLTVEAQPKGARTVVDFLDIGAEVTITIEKYGRAHLMVVAVRADNGDGYTWTELEHSFTIPAKVKK